MTNSTFLLTTAIVDVFLWAVTTWLLVRWVQLRDDRLLLWLGVITAIALQNKWGRGRGRVATARAGPTAVPRALPGNKNDRRCEWYWDASALDR
jgi:hypothetical protein